MAKSSREIWKDRQRELNRWTDKYLEGIAPLIVDGVPGHATKVRIMSVKFYLGSGKDRTASWSSPLVRRMRHPHSTRYSSKAMLRTAATRRKVQRRLAQPRDHDHDGLIKFDGKLVAAWIVPWLVLARKRGWRGYIVSGYRTPAYSQWLCYQMCGSPRCPGRCAGVYTNHARKGNLAGAIDVSDYARFNQIMRDVGAPLKNVLGARDPVHFSYSGQ